MVFSVLVFSHFDFKFKVKDIFLEKMITFD